jgi:hypothetical protein
MSGRGNGLAPDRWTDRQTGEGKRVAGAYEWMVRRILLKEVGRGTYRH